MPLDAEALLTVLCGQAISCKIAFGKTEIVNSIQQIGFAYAIQAAYTNNVFGKPKLLMIIIFELKN